MSRLSLKRNEETLAMDTQDPMSMNCTIDAIQKEYHDGRKVLSSMVNS